MFVDVSDHLVTYSESTTAETLVEYHEVFDLINLGLPVGANMSVIIRP